MKVIVYKTTCLVNGKFYIGVHRVDHEDDGYIGCGICSQAMADRYARGRSTHFQKAVAHHGYGNFRREILFEYDNEVDAYAKEAELVDPHDPMSYNQCTGGRYNAYSHGSDYIVVDTHTESIYSVPNLRHWCRERGYHTVNFRQGLQNVINGTIKLYQNRWWACHREMWSGKVVLKDERIYKPYKYADAISFLRYDGEVFRFGSAREAYAQIGGDESGFYKSIRLGIVHQGYRLYRDGDSIQPFSFKANAGKRAGIALRKQGETLEFASISEAAKTLNLSPSSLRRVRSGLNRTSGGFCLASADDSWVTRPVSKYCNITISDGMNSYIFQSAIEAEKKLGIPRSSLYGMIKGRYPSYKQYTATAERIGKTVNIPNDLF
jgi:hypothetical protein